MLRQREVIGTVVNGDGNPINGGTIRFRTTAPLAYTSSHVIVDEPVTVQTDSEGEFSITLWCDEDSLVAVNYNVYFPVNDGGSPDDSHTTSFSLQYGDGSPISISELINASIPAPEPEDFLYTYVDQAVALALGEVQPRKWVTTAGNDTNVYSNVDSLELMLLPGTAYHFKYVLHVSCQMDYCGLQFKFGGTATWGNIGGLAQIDAFTEGPTRIVEGLPAHGTAMTIDVGCSGHRLELEIRGTTTNGGTLSLLYRPAVAEEGKPVGITNLSYVDHRIFS